MEVFEVTFEVGKNNSEHWLYVVAAPTKEEAVARCTHGFVDVSEINVQHKTDLSYTGSATSPKVITSHVDLDVV